MSTPVPLKDGSGDGFKACVNSRGAVLSAPFSYPAFEQEVPSYPISKWFTDDGTDSGSNDMRVDGSSTSVDFFISANGSPRFIKSISVRISDPNAELDEFGNLAALTNGITFSYFNDAIGRVVIQDAIQTNLDFIRIGLNTPPVGDNNNAFRCAVGGSGPETYLPIIDMNFVFGMPYGLYLAAGSTDKVIFTVNDDLSSGMTAFNIIAFGREFLTA